MKETAREEFELYSPCLAQLREHRTEGNLKLPLCISKVNAEKTKYMIMSQDHNTQQNIKIQIGNKSSETVKKFKYLETTLMNKIPFMKKLRAD